VPHHIDGSTLTLILEFKALQFEELLLKALHLQQYTKSKPCSFLQLFRPDIIHLSRSILYAPVRIEITPISTTAETVVQSVYFVQKNDKRSLIIHLLNDNCIDSALVFTQTKYGELINLQCTA
jgi:hypothetical protein